MAVVVGLILGASEYANAQSDSNDVELLAFGDINLGRSVGRMVLKGDTLYPFRLMADSLHLADLVFANLESPLSDQGGRTVHPRYNMIFTGPPEGAWSLRQGGIDVVSTANNHSFDFGMRALRETIANLKTAGIAFTGTSIDSVDVFAPAIVTVKGIRVGFIAFTEFVNQPGAWTGHISVFDSTMAAEAICRTREASDVVIASYHGGAEYRDVPTMRSRQHLRWLAECGADVVVGHHPHVPLGVERRGSAWILQSLGNFVFSQPQFFWTQVGLAARIHISRRDGTVSVTGVALTPFKASLQPTWEMSPEIQDSLVTRLARGSLLQYQLSHGNIHVAPKAQP